MFNFSLFERPRWWCLKNRPRARPYFYSAVRRKRNTNPTCPGDCLSCIILSTPYLLFFIKKLTLGAWVLRYRGDARGHKYFIKGCGSHSPPRSARGRVSRHCHSMFESLSWRILRLCPFLTPPCCSVHRYSL